MWFYSIDWISCFATDFYYFIALLSDYNCVSTCTYEIIIASKWTAIQKKTKQKQLKNSFLKIQLELALISILSMKSNEMAYTCSDHPN